MTNRYRDYNDAHRLWFVCAEKLLGLRMEDVLVGGMRRGVWYRKLAWRQLFKALAVFVRADHGLRSVADLPGECDRTNLALGSVCDKRRDAASPVIASSSTGKRRPTIAKK